MANSEFSEGTKRLLREHPAFPAEQTRALAVRFVESQGNVCIALAELAYPLERLASELKAGHLPYFREGSDQDRKRAGEKKSSYRFAGFAPSHGDEIERRIAERRSGELSVVAYGEWQKTFLMRFTFEAIEQVSLRAFPAPLPSAGETSFGCAAARGRLAEALMAARRIRDDIVAGNLLLVAKIVVQRSRMHPTVLADDLFAAGSDGLLIAAGRYDPSVGQFSTYATPWITMAVDRFVAKTRHVIRLPIGLQGKLRRERRSTAAGGAPDAAVSRLLIPQVQSLEEPMGGADGEFRLEDVVADPAGAQPLADAEHRDIAQILRERVEQLDELKRFIIAMRSDVGDAAALGAQLFRQEAGLSQGRGRAIARAAELSLDDPARIRMIGTTERRADAQAVPLLLASDPSDFDFAPLV